MLAMKHLLALTGGGTFYGDPFAHFRFIGIVAPLEDRLKTCGVVHFRVYPFVHFRSIDIEVPSEDKLRILKRLEFL